MPRPVKMRKICQLPSVNEFNPSGQGRCCEAIIMSVDEFETICLIDHDGMNQQECAEQMGVARTTVQAIYSSARKKLADCLVEGKPLHIEGGDFELCQGGRNNCTKRQRCPRRQV